MSELVSVIIPLYRDWEKLKICIHALKNQTVSTRQFEIIIVNNDPEDLPPKLSLPDNFRIITEEKPGSYAARNAGIKEAEGEILAFTDADCIPDKNWISRAINIFSNKQEVDIIGGCIEQFKLEGTSDAVYKYQLQFGFNQEKNITVRNFSVTANMFTRKKVFNRIGVFDEKLLSGGDFEFGNRAHASGLNMIYCNNIIVKHPVRQKIHDLIKKKRRTKGGTYDIHKKPPRIKHFIVCFLDPILKSRQLNPSLPFMQKIKILGISWILKFTEMFEWVRLWLFNAKRLRK